MYIPCAVNSWWRTDDNGIEAWAIVEQPSYRSVVESCEELVVARLRYQRRNDALK